MNADRFCAICHQPEFDANGLRHADASSGHEFTTEGAMELHHINAREVRRGDVLLDEDFNRLGAVTAVVQSRTFFGVQLDGDTSATIDLSESVDVVGVEIAVLRPGCPECDWRGFVFMNLDTDEEGTPAHVERCDTCQAFGSDDDAHAAALFVGFDPSAIDVPELPS